MRKALWMALAWVGTAPVALAQQSPQTRPFDQPVASPSGAVSIQGQDSRGAFGIFGLQPSVQSPTTFYGAPEPQTMEPGTSPLIRAGDNGSMDMAPTYQGTTSAITSPTPLTETPSIDQGTRGTSSQQGMSSQATSSQQGTSSTVRTGSQDELTVLRNRVAALEREVGSLRGTGGSGPVNPFPATNAPATNAPATNAPSATPLAAYDTVVLPATDGTPEGSSALQNKDGSITVASAVFDGTVRKVTSKHIDIVDREDGSLYRLSLDKGTKVFRGPKLTRMSARQLSEGTRVRASFDLVSGVERARFIVVQPKKAAAKPSKASKTPQQ